MYFPTLPRPSLAALGYEVCRENLGNRIPCVSLDYFRDSVLPIMKPETVASISERIGDAYTDLSQFSMLCDAILEARPAVLKERHPQYRVHATGNEVFASDRPPTCHFKVDMAAILVDSLMPNVTIGTISPCVTDVAWACIFSEGEDTDKTAIGAAAHILFNDPGRRFVYILTVENNRARFWFFSRFMVTVTQPFNFITEREPIIHFVTALAVCSPYELGYDPTVVRVQDLYDAQKVQYEIWLDRNTTFTTLSTIFEPQETCIVSRSTRVFKAIKSGWLRDEPPCVIKDVWKPETTRAEKDIQDEIFSRMDKVNSIGEDFDEDFRERYFMNIMEDVCVCAGLEGGDDQTGNIVRNIPLARDYSWYCIAGKGLSPIRGGAEVCLRYQHRRTVFREYGKPLNAIQDHRVLFDALAQVVNGLKHLYSAGYIHRDISKSNLILCDDGKCKITDLEFAVTCEDVWGPASRERGTQCGTSSCMATEVFMRRYLFGAPIKPNTAKPLPADFCWDVPNMDPERRRRVIIERDRIFFQCKGDPLPFRQNYIHDIESVWWIAVEALFVSLPITSPPDATQPAETDDIFADTDYPTQKRYEFFALERQFFSTMERSLPRPFTRLIRYLNATRRSLLNAYALFAQHCPEQGFDYEWLYPLVWQDLTRASMEAEPAVRWAPRWLPPHHRMVEDVHHDTDMDVDMF